MQPYSVATMKYKAIFIDVDGTLLTDDLLISSGTKKVLEKLSNLGLLIVIVTARPPDAALPFYHQLNILNNPIICFNGALIIQDGTVLYEEYIDSKDVKNILKETEAFVVNRSLYSHCNWFTNDIDRWIKQETEITNVMATTVHFDDLVKDQFCPNKILCMGEMAEINALEKHLNALDYTHLNIHKSKPTYLEIVNKNASKSKGIIKVLEKYGIHKEAIITIGDNYNDIDMFLLSATSIAMGNAPDDVKNKATIITDTNNNEGIQKALNNLFA